MPASLDGLSRAQLAAVTHPEGPLLVLAGAGTGKTRTLTSRFAWLVEQGMPAEQILALTFSSPAAAEMRERLEALIESPYESLHVATFHAFCARLLQDEALEAGVDPFLTPVTPADRLALLLERLGELTIRRHEIRGNPAPLLASFVARIDRLKDELVTAEEYRTYAEGLEAAAEQDGDAARATAARELEFAGIYADHDRLLAERGALDFGDLVMRAFRLLHEHPHVRERASQRYRHVLVDEYQDTNFAQGMLLRPAGRRAPQRDGGRRRRPGDLPLPRRLPEEPPRLPARVPRRRGGPARAQPPLRPPHPHRGAGRGRALP